MSIVLDKEPKLLWKHFDELRKIPRCSKHEEKVREYILDFAKSHALNATTDDAGNVVVSKPATPGYENKQVLVLQGHLDMVCEKNSDLQFDFNIDPIQLKIDGEYLTADGTSLGADNGIGVATTLAILEDETLQHGAIEGLFTVDEETGLTGAFQLSPDFLIGRTMLNLDSEEEGAIYVGCAGGGDTTIKLPLESTTPSENVNWLKVTVTGLRGGHSGIDIGDQRGNAIKILGRLISKASGKLQCEIAKIVGGSKRNAIPREASTIVNVRTDDLDDFKAALQLEGATILAEISPIDPDFKVNFEDIEPVAQVFNKPTTDKLLNLLNGLPHGVLAMNFDISDLIETSTNLATIETQNDIIQIGMSTRSSIGSALEASRGTIRAIATLAGANVIENPPYPGWKPNMDSNVLKLAKQVISEQAGKEPDVKAIHAGLECGIIGEKFTGMDMISIGPNIFHPHSPDEKVDIGSVKRFYDIVLKIIDTIN
jgi:dipeptidase D